jgi:XTP/dITP diphosphohydrolase
LAADLLLATRSTDKLREIRQIISVRSRLLTLGDLGIEPSSSEDDIEAQPTFLENAIAKARHFAQLTGMATLADDSGLAVDALRGGPGVRTKRFAADNGIVSDDVDQANNDLLLEQLHHIPDGQRGAHYVCVAAFASPARVIMNALGTCSGRIVREPRGDGGFGYDPLFLIPDLGVTFAQLTMAEKNSRSHRARAFRALVPHLKVS